MKGLNQQSGLNSLSGFVFYDPQQSQYQAFRQAADYQMQIARTRALLMPTGPSRPIGFCKCGEKNCTQIGIETFICDYCGTKRDPT
jgi:hypothetical protein